MRIAVFAATADPTDGFRTAAMAAFHRGLVAEGERDAVLVEGPDYVPCDVAVVSGLAKGAEKTAPHLLARRAVAAAHDGVSVHLETPFLGRTVYLDAKPFQKAIGLLLGRAAPTGRRPTVNRYDHFRVGVNGVFPDTADYCNANSPPDRWEALSREFGLRLAPWRRDGGPILVIGQLPRDVSLAGLDMLRWLGETIVEIRRHSDRPIVVRPHPLMKHHEMATVVDRVGRVGKVDYDLPPKGPIAAALAGAWATVTYSSTAAVDSLLAGVPALTFSPLSIAWPVTDHDLARIETPTLHPREQWLRDLAYAQWSAAEMADGTVWRRLRDTVRADHAARRKGAA
jgi:hypothetical protein